MMIVVHVNLLRSLADHQAMGLGFLKGCTSTAFTGQAISQLKQVQQSWANLISALLSASMTITSPGQIISQIVQPTHALLSILRIMELPPCSDLVCDFNPSNDEQSAHHLQDLTAFLQPFTGAYSFQLPSF
jgi:hypothetical protein